MIDNMELTPEQKRKLNNMVEWLMGSSLKEAPSLEREVEASWDKVLSVVDVLRIIDVHMLQGDPIRNTMKGIEVAKEYIGKIWDEEYLKIGHKIFDLIEFIANNKVGIKFPKRSV